MRRAFTLVEVVLAMALLSLLTVVLAGSFTALRKSTLARTRKLESRLPMLQSTQRLAQDLHASGSEGIGVYPDLVSICPTAPLTATGKTTWSRALQVWAWRPAQQQLRVYRLTPEAAQAEGFVGQAEEPLRPDLSDLQAYVDKQLPTGEIYALAECRFTLASGDLLEIEVAGLGKPAFRLSRTVGFRL
jgi:prepilin-type N-terminal cleavage/methylation domain-containing protein